MGDDYDYKDALREVLNRVYRNTDDCEMCISKDCYKLIIEALERQISKKPYFGEALGYKGFNGYLCPICRNWLLYPDEIPNSRDSFCSFCGQKIDWSEVKNERLY